ncbi:MAG: sulfatase-like hydrolase/transferase [Bacteroidales bacterium]|jgi:arylsulfatase A-like enzyme|nr:sulfatase-like hydrolase/transferase [Bacteroidales bacterium]
MGRKSKIIATIFFLLILVFTYLLWPLKSSEFAIEFNEEAFVQKKAFLNEKPDSIKENRPNILLITADDLSVADVSIYKEGTIKTPNIEKLGDEGIVFENAYVTSPICSPSRAAIFTGRYPQRYGFQFQMHDRYLKNRLEYIGFKYFMNSYPWIAKWMPAVPDEDAIEKQGLPPTEISLAELLKKYGYKTGLIGKWHLGSVENNTPCAFGFDTQYGFMASHSLYAPEGTTGIIDQKIKDDWTDQFIWAGQRNGPHAIYKNCEKVEETGYLTDRITEESITFIDTKSEEPFFLWVSYNAPHTPLQAPEAYVEKYDHITDPIRRVHVAMINSLDDAIGRLLSHLEKTGLDENTIIFFLSDNGGAEYNLTTDNGPYFGGKTTDFEGGLKVPMIIKWKNHLKEGVRYKPMVSSLDVFATSSEVAGAEIFSEKPIDGANLIPFLTDSTSDYPHDYLFWQRGFSKALRTNTWKFILNEEAGDTMLFDLLSDPYEIHNVSASNTAVSEALIEAHNKWSGQNSSPLWPSMIYFYSNKDGEEYYFDQ